MTFLDFLWTDCASNLAGYLVRQRWYAGKARPLQAVRLADLVWLRSPPAGLALAILQCQYADGEPEFYSLLLGFQLGEKPPPVPAPSVILPKLVTLAGPAALYDATAEPAACQFLLELFKLKQPLPARFGQVLVVATPIFPQLRGTGQLKSQPVHAEQSHRNFAFLAGSDPKLMLKLFGRLEPGVNPDYEMSLMLTEETSFSAMPPLAGAISYVSFGQDTTLAMLFGYEANEGTGWEMAQRHLAEVAEVAPHNEPTDDDLATLLEGPLTWATRLGQRTGELHKALASVTKQPSFAPEPMQAEDIARIVARLSAPAQGVAELWKQAAAQEHIRDRLASLAGQTQLGKLIRVHGDYHLGQVLCRGGDFIIIDFEGEPTQPRDERRRRRSPLRDVAGMLRSFDYAASVALRQQAEANRARLEPWLRGWQNVVTQAFLHGYFELLANTDLLPADEAAKDALLWLYTLEKALYEVQYEREHRPDWVEVPMEGVRSLLRL